MLPQEIIRAKRDGERAERRRRSPSSSRGITDGSVAEGQVAAFAMAVFFRGMTVDEAVALTRAMTASGTQLSWDLDGPVLDKHSTGGVGDTVSLMLAPMVAACGGFVPMISGRGLGHTGGTYDKFESIPGYRAAPTMAEFRRVVGKVGCAVIGQTSRPRAGRQAPLRHPRRHRHRREHPADHRVDPVEEARRRSRRAGDGRQGRQRRVHGQRDSDAEDLARSIVGVAEGAGVPTTALLTDMDQPLADAAGNALEMAYAIDYLTGDAPPGADARGRRSRSVRRCCVRRQARRGPSPAGRAALQASLDSGAGGGAVREDGADARRAHGSGDEAVEAHGAGARRASTCSPTRAGTVTRIDTRAVGLAVVVARRRTHPAAGPGRPRRRAHRPRRAR